LLDKNQNVTFIDFDYCILDSYLHDLSSFLVRVLRANNWDENIAYEIINSYSEVNSINKDKLDVMKGFIRYPQGFWQLGLQAYWERQPWKSEKFNKRLEKYIIESKYREKFIQKFY
ncbi:MAG: CotS family spore coat protein, partial [Clostridium sp.]